MEKELVLTNYLEKRVNKCREAYGKWLEHMWVEHGEELVVMNNELLIAWALDDMKEKFEKLIQEDEDEAAEETNITTEADYEEPQAECSELDGEGGNGYASGGCV